MPTEAARRHRREELRIRALQMIMQDRWRVRAAIAALLSAVAAATAVFLLLSD